MNSSDPILRSCPVPTAVVDTEGRILEVNEAFMGLFGEDPTGRGVEEIFECGSFHVRVLELGSAVFECQLKGNVVKLNGSFSKDRGIVVYTVGGCKNLFEDLKRYVSFYEFLTELTKFVLL